MFGSASSENSENEDGENDEGSTEWHQLIQTRFEEGYDLPDLFGVALYLSSSIPSG